jgi:hypothetical protein
MRNVISALFFVITHLHSVRCKNAVMDAAS